MPRIEYRIRYALDNGRTLVSDPIDGDHEYTDRLAKQLLRDPHVVSSEVIVNPAEALAAA